MQLQTMPTRSCGECSACCRVFSIPEVGKLDSSWCQYCTVGKGCTIYDSRPGRCRSFSCSWLQGQMGDDFRPDRIGVMIYYQDIHARNRPVRVMHVYEMRAKALEQPAIARMIKENETAGMVIVCRRERDERSYNTSGSMDRKHFTQDEAAAIFAQLKSQEIAINRQGPT